MIRKIIKTLFVFTLVLGVIGFSLIVLLVFIGADKLDKARWFGGKKSSHVPIKGGSMYPSFAWCNNKNEEGVDDCASLANEDSRLIIPVLLNFDKDFKLERGMIISTKIEQKGLIKRVIGLPNETVRLDGGYVYINNNKINEPYIWKNGSTFGDDFLSNCRDLRIPEGQVFVMGDNRIWSKDSRNDGLISIDTIEEYLPIKYQTNLQKRWEKLGNQKMNKLDFNSRDFSQKIIALINKIRKEKNLKEMSEDMRLTKAASMRAKSMVENEDYSFEPKKSKTVNYESAFRQAGFIDVMGKAYEAFEQGIYDEELYLYSLKNVDFLLNEKLTKVGVSAYEGKVNECNNAITVIYGLVQ